MNQLSSPVEARTKIVATVGPACRDPERLTELAQAGVDVFRLNMAHASREDQAEVVGWIREVSCKIGRPIATLCDLAGPKIRIGQLPGDERELKEGEQIRFVRGSQASDPNDLTTSYARLIDELSPGDNVMLADGTIALVVEEKSHDAIVCRVVQPGLLRSRQGVNLPGVKLSVPSMTAADLENAQWAAEQEIDFVGLSFVREAADVRLLKDLLRIRGSRALVIAKIEKQQALDHLDDIVQTADGVMVARGDLGVEIDVARMPVVQKEIVELCNRRQKPVIIATQMLDSMQHSRRPTRAEVTDVANAILDGCDACMLSGETAIGQFPRQTVEMMQRIALATEPKFRNRTSSPSFTSLAEGLHPVTQGVVEGASRIAIKLDARMIVVASRSGVTALAVAKQRNFIETIGVSDSEATLRQMCLYWGVTPLAGATSSDGPQILEHVCNWARGAGRLVAGDRIVLVAGVGMGVAGHNMALVHEVK